MKTLQQRLQSRISKRRNKIRELEILSGIYYSSCIETLKCYGRKLHRQTIDLGKEQKLDKDIMKLVVRNKLI